MNYNCYKGKKILVTGHTGFKGSWITRWLEILGAEVTGYSLNPPTEPSHFGCLELQSKSIIEDVRDYGALKKAIEDCQPELIFHLAAQPLVRYSYRHPIETFETNILGTVNLLNACRSMETIRGVIIVTSDKCYSDSSAQSGYKEDDPLGGDDPYSCSKSCAELVVDSYRKSYFSSPNEPDEKSIIASARAGNVIGGGDWGQDRLLPDIVNAMVKDADIVLRNPKSVRPWQHVLDALSGYLLIGEKLLEGQAVGSAWNFGPQQTSTLSVEALLNLVSQVWGKKISIQEQPSSLKESQYLRLDITKASEQLGWSPVWDAQESVRRTVDWYKAYYEQETVMTEKQIIDYMNQTP